MNRDFHRDILNIDPATEVNRITTAIKRQVYQELKKYGAVIAVSGGIDSSITLALTVRALGKENVVALSLPERHSSGQSRLLGKTICSHLDVEMITRNISPVLEAFGVYSKLEDSIKKIFPDFDQATFRFKLALSQGLMKTGRLNLFHLIIEDSQGHQFSKRLTRNELLEIIAVMNHKQRTRKQIEYYHADRLNYAVIGTPNRLEYDQGFFVKGGDGLADLKPIAHLYKTQVYLIGEYLGLPEKILAQQATTDTYSLHQTQEEFFFSLPLRDMDLFLYAVNQNISAELVASELDYTLSEVKNIFNNILRKRKTTAYLHRKELLTVAIPEIKI